VNLCQRNFGIKLSALSSVCFQKPIEPFSRFFKLRSTLRFSRPNGSGAKKKYLSGDRENEMQQNFHGFKT